jgi:hypothetical protein
MATAINQANTPLLATIGVGDYALAAVTEAVQNARSRAADNVETARERVADFPEEFNTQLSELRNKLEPEELRKVADAYVQAAAGIYVSLAERGDEVIAKVGGKPQNDQAPQHADDLDEFKRQTDTVAAAMKQMQPTRPPTPAPSAAAQVSGPVWSTEQVRVALGRRGGAPVSRQAVDDRVRRGTLLALRVAEHGERAYPLWQFVHGQGRWEVLPGLAALLRAVPETVADRWTLASWLRQPHPALNERSPLQHLTEHGQADEQLLRIAQATAARWAA